MAVITGLTACLLGMAPSSAGAFEEGDDFGQIPSCGAVSIDHELWQPEPGVLRVHGFAQSRRNFDGCFSKMRVEAWIEGLTMATLISEGYGMSASVWWSIPVPYYRTWHSISKHWLINFGGWLWNGWGHASADVEPTTGNETVSVCNSEEPCQAPSGGGPDSGSPLLLDPSGDGFRLTSAGDGVLFDLDADGALDQVAWTDPDGDDVWLAMDRNGNGTIDDGSELFGNATPAYPGSREQLARNGFEALRFLEGPDFGVSNGDSIVDARDAVFARLLLWRDANHNGLSEPGELTLVLGSALMSVASDYKEVGRRDQHGNLFKQRGTSTWARGDNVQDRHVYDVWLRIDR